MFSFLSAGKRRIIVKSVIESESRYYSLTWMFWVKSTSKINRLHERSLRVGNSDNESTYEELLSCKSNFSIHDQNIQRLAAEIYKVANDLSGGDFKTLFDFKGHYKLILNWTVKIQLGILGQ